MHSYDVICVGMALVDSIIMGFDPNPVSASGYRAASGSLNVGGEAVNEAMAAAKLGLKTGILCSLGEDAAGDMIVSALQRCGVDPEPILRSAAHPTPVTTMFVREDGTRRSITNSAHRYNFHPERHTDRFSGARALILGSLFRAPFDDPEIIHAVLTAAKAEGQLVFADTKLPNFRFLTLEDLRDSLPLIDYITPNEDEARYYSGKENPEEMAEVFLARGVKNVIIKLGGRGCLLKCRDERHLIPAAEGVNCLDTTGAGDTFAAAFIAGILEGESFLGCGRLANAAASLCVESVGATEGAWTRAEAEQRKGLIGRG